MKGSHHGSTLLDSVLQIVCSLYIYLRMAVFMTNSERAQSGIWPNAYLITILRTRGGDTPTGAGSCSWRLGATNQLVLADLARTILDARAGRLKWVRRCNFGEFLRLAQYIGESKTWHENDTFSHLVQTMTQSVIVDEMQGGEDTTAANQSHPIR
jgi:hypothetical protein